MRGEVHPERLEKAVDDMDEAVHSAAESRHHLEKAADRLEELVEVWKPPPAGSAEHISDANPSD